jgi:hypothetical protein
MKPKKPKKFKPRIKVAPPSQRHRSAMDYDRKQLKEDLNKALKSIGLDDTLVVDEVMPTELEEKIKNFRVDGLTFDDWLDKCKNDMNEAIKEPPRKHWFDSFMSIFGFRRNK